MERKDDITQNDVAVQTEPINVIEANTVVEPFKVIEQIKLSLKIKSLAQKHQLLAQNKLKSVRDPIKTKVQVKLLRRIVFPRDQMTELKTITATSVLMKKWKLKIHVLLQIILSKVKL